MTADAERWASARNLPDLAALVIAWLNGEIGETPIYEGGPCEDKLSLAAILTAVNRAGLVTDNAAPAGADDDGEDMQNAWIEGFADDATEAALLKAVRGTDLVYCASRRFNPLREGVGEDWDAWMDSCPEAARALYHAWHVVIEDPRPGRDDVLWPALEAFAREAAR